ncbi:MAG TPA: LuxR C-terminal-related transcriptional regulator [Ktedonobacteraceae bacterium]|nr:LuxR C-terminal-related transcriptional regulator [Ktedonobacteraceae bacterium]
MPKALEHTLIWEEEHQQYQLSTHGQPQQGFYREDEAAFSRWLARHSSFAFVGQAGRLSVIKEGRGGGTGYWYAYRTQNRHTHKRYLGSTDKVTLARLEQEASLLTSSSPPPVPSSGAPSPSSSQQRVIVLSAKLSAPRLPLALVVRPRLLQELKSISSHRLTLLCAPAGSGKTTLLSAWAASQRSAHGAASAVVWLSLDELDNDLVRFWSSVIAALRTCRPGIGEEALAMLHSRQSPPLPIILMTFLNELLAVGREIVLILDDYHVIEDQTIEESMRFLIEHMPDHLHLVLNSRTEPALPLARLRVRSQLLELRADELHFTRQEATSFLTEVMNLPLTEEDVITLQERTEGWIAGLQLAALSMRRQDHLSAWVKDFAGSHRYLLDYVQQEILARLPIRLQHFLLQTSILTRMNASVCQAVTASTGEQANQEILEELEQANLFVVPLDEQRQWYRFHHLFRDVLLVRLQASQPENVTLLHQRAASWYEAQGYIYDAMFHAQATADGSFTASLLERVAEEMWLQGEAQMVFAWVKALPDSVIRQHWNLVQTAVHHLMIRTYQGSEEQHARALEEMQRMIARFEHIFLDKGLTRLPLTEERRLHNRLSLGRLWGATSYALATRDVKQLRPLGQEMWPVAQGDAVIWQMMPLFNDYMDAMYFLVDMSSLISTVQEVNRLAEREQNRYEFFRTREWLARAHCESGKLKLAYSMCQETLHLLEQEENRRNFSIEIEGHLRLTLARLYGVWNQQEEAFTQLRELLQNARSWSVGAQLVDGCSVWMMLALETGRLIEAGQALEEMAQFKHQAGFAYSPSNLEARQAQLWLAQGNLAAAEAWARASCPLSPEALESVTAWEDALTVARVHLALGRSSQALEVLSPLLESAQQGKRLWNQLRVLALQVVALQQSGKREQAREVAANLLAESEAEGYIRVYLDAGHSMKEVLGTLQEAPLDDFLSADSLSFLSRVLVAFQQEEAQRAGRARASLSRPSSPTRSQGLVEPLSPQELRVLSLLVAGQTYEEMAQALIVSPNTIKTQVGSIYRKLGVSRRAQAIEAAARLHLLSSEYPGSFGNSE